MSINKVDRNRIREEAACWLSKCDFGFTAQEQDEFFDWMATDPMHSEAYYQRWCLWSRMSLLAEWKPEHSSEPNPDLISASVKI